MTTPAKALETAAREIGYDRFQDPEQGTKYGRWYASIVKIAAFAANGIPYCAMFISWLFNLIGGSLFGDGTVYAYCPFIERDARAKGRIRSFADAQPGDVVLFDWDDDGLADHVGIIVRREGDYLHTIEGNTSNSSADNGGKVLRRVRHRSTVRCIVIPAYAGVTPTPTPAPVALAVDGVWGPATTSALQRALGTPADGVISSQNAANLDYYPAAGAGWEWSNNPQGSQVITALQRRVGAGADGIAGFETAKALQRYLGVEADGYVGEQTVKALQHRLNGGGF